MPFVPFHLTPVTTKLANADPINLESRYLNLCGCEAIAASRIHSARPQVELLLLVYVLPANSRSSSSLCWDARYESTQSVQEEFLKNK